MKSVPYLNSGSDIDYSVLLALTSIYNRYKSNVALKRRGKRLTYVANAVLNARREYE
jgi:hypothetical protein